MMNRMDNQIYFEPSGLIHVQVVGHQTAETVKEVEDEVRAMTAQLRESGKDVYIIVELTHGVSQGLPARQAAKHFLSTLDYERIAIYGAKPFLRHVVNMIVAGSVRDGRVKNFATRAEALDWLGAN